MLTLLIDNYDSFTFNLYQLIAKVNGVPPIVVRNDGATWMQIEEMGVDNIVISPGPGRPERTDDFGVSAEVIAHARLPVLGVCLGHQGIAHAFGAKIILAPKEMHGRISRIRHDGGALFASIPREFDVVRYHSLLVDEASLPAELKPTAWSDDGLVMALAHASRPLFGVQFHPESICTEYGETLLANFRDLTPRRATKAVHVPPSLLPGSRRSAAPNRYAIRFAKLDWQDPECAFDALYARSTTAFWLDSSLDEQARFSFVGDAAGPLSLTLSYSLSEGRCTVLSRDGEKDRMQSVFDIVREILSERAVADPALPFDFQGGFVGYLGYELKAECGGEAEHAAEDPDAQLHFCDRFIAFDHRERVVYVVALSDATALVSDDTSAWISRVEESLSSLSRVVAQPVSSAIPAKSRTSRSKRRYLHDIETCLKAIRHGESYELCLTNNFHVDASIDSLALHKDLRRRSPAPYAAFLRFENLDVVSSSPERFLRIDAKGHVESKPIKGTRARGETKDEDETLAAELAASEKDRAENLMIVDLVRNDLGQVCEVGSVRVPKLMDVETYASVHQLVSTVQGKLRADADAVDCIRSAFPGGSMTGAPKRRTMQILDTLEDEARGVYSGAIGYLSVSGAVDLSIAIRCALVRKKRVSIGAGGAIVAQSDPEAEFEEAQLKARALLEAITAVRSEGGSTRT